jgi:hypothetical protein
VHPDAAAVAVRVIAPCHGGFGQNLIDSFVEAKYFARDHIVTNGGPPAISQTLLNRLAR